MWGRKILTFFFEAPQTRTHRESKAMLDHACGHGSTIHGMAPLLQYTPGCAPHYATDCPPPPLRRADARVLAPQ